MTWHVYVSKCTNVRQSKVGSIVTTPIVIAAADGIDRDDVGVIMMLMVMVIVLMQ